MKDILCWNWWYETSWPSWYHCWTKLMELIKSSEDIYLAFLIMSLQDICRIFRKCRTFSLRPNHPQINLVLLIVLDIQGKICIPTDTLMIEIQSTWLWICVFLRSSFFCMFLLSIGNLLVLVYRLVLIILDLFLFLLVLHFVMDINLIILFYNNSLDL